MKDTLPLHRKFGYAAMVEKQAIRAAIIAEGSYEPLTLEFLVSQRYIDAHKDDPTYREICELRRPQKPMAPSTLTAEQWSYLAERLDGANDPIGAAICEIAKQNLPG